MPLELLEITQPNEEQYEDLLKIYDGYTDTDPASIRQWLELQLNNGYFIFGGLFNGSLVASATANHQGEDIQIANFCVRAVTRRRGVARQMLMLFGRYAEANNKRMTISMSITPTVLHGLLEESGFKQDQLVWAYVPKNH